MWIPDNEAELNSVLSPCSLSESASFDAKQQIATNTLDVAKDLAAMANEGGVIAYGIGEDTAGNPCIASPFGLKGCAERITAIARTAIAPPLTIIIKEIPLQSDPSLGYLFVQIPPSEQAPHMVTVQGHNRYYGRTATGNDKLTEPEVAHLHERRSQWRVDAGKLLQAEINRWQIPARPDLAYLYAFARPNASTPSLLDSVKEPGQPVQTTLTKLIQQTLTSQVYAGSFMPDFSPPAWRRVPEGYLGEMGDGSGNIKTSIDLQIDHDGTCHLFVGRAAEERQGTVSFFASIAAATTARLMAFSGLIFERASYLGQVDVGVAITGLQGAILHSSEGVWIQAAASAFRDREYRRTARVTAAELASAPRHAAKRLLDDVFAAFSNGKLDPLA